MIVTVIDRDGVEHRLEADLGLKLMLVIRAAGLPIKAECGGNCICSTCHVYVDPAWAERLPGLSDDEIGTLEAAIDVRPTSRLSCQIIVTADLDGLRVTLAPEED